jgi:uncharacterized delta-60 repeat protein
MFFPPDGTRYSGFSRGALVRYNKDGSLDTTFGTGGKITTTEILGIPSVVNALSIQSDGKIIAAGSSNFGGNSFPSLPTGSDFGLVRYNENGSVDTTFGVQGKVATDLGLATDLNTQHDYIYAVSLQPDGKIVVAGDSSVDYGYPVVGLARYNRDGSLDTIFGLGGKVRMDLPFLQSASARFIGIQPEGKIVVAGGGRIFAAYERPSSTSFELARYNTSGLQLAQLRNTTGS